jgi:hypothetical protein
MRRHRHRSAVRRAALALLVAVAALALGGVAGAQTTTTTVPPTTLAPVTTTAGGTGTATTAAGGTGTATTAAPGAATTVPVTTTAQDDSDDGGIPWIPIAIGVVVLLAIIAAIAMLARRRGAMRQAVVDWGRKAADATAEAGATARLLSGGTPPSGQIAQQLITSLRTFEDLAESAPTDSTAATAERARRAIQMLGLAIDADYRLRRTQPAPPPERLAQSQQSVQTAAGETDRTLRGVYRSFTGGA